MLASESTPSSSADAPEGADVLGQAATAEAEARAQEAPPDPGVVRHRFGEADHVRADLLADLGDRVDEGDLGREEGIGRQLHQFRRFQVHDQRGRASVERLGIDLAERVGGCFRFHAKDQPVG